MKRRPLVEPAEALRVLQGFNPWWAGRNVSVPSYHRLAFEACRGYLGKTALRRAILLSGPRRVGKTTVLEQIAARLITDGEDPRSVLFLSLDHPLVKLIGLEGALRLYHEAIHPERRRTWLLLNEVQYARGWESEVKLLVDHHPEYRIAATGSASVVHRQKLAESGVGRWVTVPVPTLSFYEFVRIRGDAVPELQEMLRPSDLAYMSRGQRLSVAARLRELLPSFQHYLLVGGFPETALLGDLSLCQRLLREDVVERVLKRDMTALFGVRKVEDLERLFVYLCLHSGGVVAHEAVAQALGTAAVTVANHLLRLEQANLVYKLPPIEMGGKRVLKARNKYYLVDAALRNAVLLRGEEVLSDPQEMGTIVETTILRSLFAFYYRDTPRIGYWREPRTGKEVDIVVRSPSYVIPVEVKYREKPELSPDDGLVRFAQQEPVRVAYWVTKSEDDFGPVRVPGVETTFLKVPAHVLTYLLGQAERLAWTP